MIKRLFAYFAKRSHDVRVQLLCATIYGLLSIFGFGGTVAIIIKARKLTKVRKPSSMTKKVEAKP